MLAMATYFAVMLQGGGATPFDNWITALQTFFTGPLAKGLVLIAIVTAGISYMFSKNSDNQGVAKIALGAAVVLFAANILAWITSNK